MLEVLSLSAFCRDEQDLEEKLRYCGEKDIRLQVKDARISPDVYLDILYFDEARGTKEAGGAEEAQYKGIVKALEKKKEGAGSYGRPRASLPEDFKEQVEYCQKNHIPLETYRRRTSLKKATFYKYVKQLSENRC